MKVTKKLLAILLGLTLVFSMGISAVATETTESENTNLLLNSGFEDSTATASTANWNDTEGEFSSDAHSGSYAFGSNNNVSYISQHVKVSPGTRYKLTYWVKATSNVTASTEDASARPRVRIHFYTSEPTSATEQSTANVGYITFDAAVQRNEAGWRRIEIYFTTEEDSNGAQITLYATSYSNGNSWKVKEAYLIDDVSLEKVEEDIQLQGASAIAPLSLNYFQKSSYTAVTNAVNTCWTLQPVTAVTNGTTIYASAYAPKTTSAVLMYGLYSADATDNRVLKSVKVAYPDTNGMLSASIDVPDDGGKYTLEAFALENLAELSPAGDKIIIQ